MLDPYTYRCPAGHPDPCPVCSGAPHLEEILQYEGAGHGRGRDPRDGRRDERDHRPARRLPPVDPRGLRPARDPADLRRGDGRLRPHGQVVRRRQLGRRPGHPHGREGDQLRLRAARRDDRPQADRRLGQGQVLRRRAHVQRPPARLRRPRSPRSRRSSEEGIVEHAAEMGAGASARRCEGLADAAPVDRRRARARLLLGARARQEPRDARAARARSTRPARRSRRWPGRPRPRSTAGST